MRAIDIRDLDIPEQDADYDELADFADKIAVLATDAIEVAPVRRGRWLDKEDPYGFFDTIPVCSECGCTTKMRETYKYCPYCGAKMEG